MWSDLRVRLTSLFRRSDMEREMAEELRAHVERETEKLIATGLSRPEARRQASLALGGVEQIKEQTRDARGTRWLEEAWFDTRHAFRLLWKQKRFTAALVLTMALGVGANTAVAGAIDEILWRPLTMPDADRIVTVFGFDKTASRYGQVSLPDIRDLEKSASLQAFAGYWRRPVRVTFGGQSELLTVEVVTASYFRVLTAPFVAGRPFSTDDEATSAPIAIISELLWRERFGSAADVVGHRIQLENQSVPIVGVASRQYRGDHNLNWYPAPDVWIPTSAVQTLYGGRWEKNFQARTMGVFVGLGRLASSASVAGAESEVNRMFASVRPAKPGGATNVLRVFPAAESKFYPGYRDTFTRNLSAFGFATILILVLAAANVANLLVERTSRRQREMAIRSALGAGRGRVIRQLFVEGLVLAAPGFVLSLLIATALQRVLTTFPSALGVSLEMDLGITNRVLIYCGGVSVLVAALASLLPSLRSAREGVAPLLKHAVAGGTRRSRSYLSQSLTVVQVSVSAVLLVGALVLARGLWNAHIVPLGFDPSRTVVVALSRYSEFAGKTLPLPARVLDRAAWAPTSVTHLALGGNQPFFGGSYRIPVQDPASREVPVPVTHHNVSGGFFETLQIPILAGRTFDATDAAVGETVIVDAALARRLWGAESALGRHVTIDKKSHTVVGVVGNTRYIDVWGSDERHIYRPIDGRSEDGSLLFLRTEGRAESVLPAVVKAWNTFAPNLPIEEAMTGNALKARALEPMRLAAWLIGAFTILAIVIAGIGLYSTIAWLVEQRSHEIAVRIAIGGLPRRIGGIVVGKAVLLTMAGSVVGFALAMKLVPNLSGFTHDLASNDLWVMTTSAVVLIGVSLLAAAVPTRRAVRIDPIVILKSE